MESTDVLIVAAGPCGMTIANLLGVYGVEAIVIDRETDIIDYPRAVGIDDESLRTCQTIGLVDEVLADTLQNMPIRYYTSWGRCFAHVEPSARPFGWARRNLFLQPLLERTLRAGVTRFAGIDTRYGHELVSLVPGATSGEPVVATVRDPQRAHRRDLRPLRGRRRRRAQHGARPARRGAGGHNRTGEVAGRRRRRRCARRPVLRRVLRSRSVRC